MGIQIKIPTPLRKLTDGKDMVEVSATSIGEALNALESAHPGIKTKICDDSGNVRRFINVYANQDDIRFQEKLETPLKDGDEVSIIPAIAGGV